MLLLAAAFGAAFFGALGFAEGRDVSVTDYGAIPNGQPLCTEAFRRAVADIAAAGGGVLRVPSGTYFTGPFNLTSHMVLWLAHGATLRADVERSRLPLLPALPSYGPAWGVRGRDARAPVKGDFRDAIPRYQSLLYGVGLRNVTITGENGTIDAGGIVWWQRWLDEPLYGRPHVIQFERSLGIRIDHITIRNPGFWAVHLWRCEHVEVRRLTILVPYDTPVRPTNTDGVNPDSSSHVLIEDSYLQTGDDAVAVKSGWDCWGRREGVPARNITIRRVTVRQTHGNNAAGVAIGSEMSGGVHDVVIEDCLFIHVGVAVEVKVGTVRGGYVRNIIARNLIIEESNRAALVVMASYPEQSPFCHDVNPPSPKVSDVTYEHVRIRGPTHQELVHLYGAQSVTLEDITIRNVTGRGPWVCEMVTGKAVGNIPPGCRQLRRGQDVLGPRRGRPSWRNDGRCGEAFPGSDGFPSGCPTPHRFAVEARLAGRRAAEPWLRHAPCCSEGGWCGAEPTHCSCEACVDYSRVTSQPLARPGDAKATVAQQAWAAPTTAVLRDTPRAGPARRRVAGRHRSARSEIGTNASFSGAMMMQETQNQALQGHEQPPGSGLVSSCCMFVSVLLCCIVLKRRALTGKRCGPAESALAIAAVVMYSVAWRWAAISHGPQGDLGSIKGAGDGAGAGVKEDSQSDTLGVAGPPALVEPAPINVWPRSGCTLGGIVTPMDFGAYGDGLRPDTQAVMSALRYGATCTAIVVVGPKGRRFLVEPGAIRVELKGITLRFEGEIVGPSLMDWNPNLGAWPPGSCAYGEAFCSRAGKRSPEFVRSRWSLLHIVNSSDVVIEGPGGLSAPGRTFWDVRNARPGVRGYCLLKIDGSQRIRASGLSLQDSPMYQVVVMSSHDVQLTGFKIVVHDETIGDGGPHNTDGVSIIASSHVTLRDSWISSGDDNIVIKEGTHHVLAERLHLLRGKGISIGSLGERGANGQVVRDIHFRDVTLQRSMHGARIKTWKGGNGLVQNVSFEAFKLKDVFFGVLIDQNYCPLSQRPEGCDGDGGEAVLIDDVRYQSFEGSYTFEAVREVCVRCTGVRYQDVRLAPAARLLGG